MTLVKLPERPVLVPRDGNDRPMVVPKAGGKPTAHTRTTTFIDCIDDKSNLTNWGKRMVLKGAAIKPSLLDVARDLDPKKDRSQLDALAEKALEAAGGNDRRDKGSHLHELSECVDRGEQLPERTKFGITTQADLMDMAAYKLATVSHDVRDIERMVVINILRTAGTPDRTSDYAGPGPLKDKDGKPLWIEGRFITDLKTGNMEYGHLKMASQLGVYSRGEFYDPSHFPAPERLAKDEPGYKEAEKAWTKWKNTVFPPEVACKAYAPIGDINMDWGIIIGLEPGSAEVEMHWVDLNKGWAAATLALDIRKMRSTPKPMIPFAVTSVTPSGLAISGASV